jgi:hypothetical protein
VGRNRPPAYNGRDKPIEASQHLGMRSTKSNPTSILLADIAALRVDLAALSKMVATLADKMETGRASYTQHEFQERHALSESQFHKLVKLGKGPRQMETGLASRRISRGAEAAWIEDREAEGEAKREAENKTREPGGDAKGRGAALTGMET